MEILNIKDIILELSYDQKRQFLQLLHQLTHTYDNLDLMTESLTDIILNLSDNQHIFIVLINNNIVGTATLLIEQKIIHNFSKMAHIEDVVVDSNYRNKQLGKLIINTCINKAKEFNCYKIILNCSDYNQKFYEKCLFKKVSNGMEIRFI